MTDWVDPAGMWNERFAREEAIYGDQPNAYLRAQAARLKPGMSVFVPGDGYGRNGIWLASQGMNVRTVDLSSVGVERSRARAAKAGLSLISEVADLSTWSWPENEFDSVAAIFVHLPSEIRGTIHARMLKSLRSGGLLILEAFSPKQLRHSSGGPKQVEMLYTAEQLRSDFAGAEILELEEAEIQIAEGPLHSGAAEVVRGVFRKK